MTDRRIFCEECEDDKMTQLSLATGMMEKNPLITIKNVTLQQIIIHIDDKITEPKYYRDIFSVIENANESDVVIFKINSDGGDAATFVELYNHILNCKAKTIADVYSAASAAALIIPACDEVFINEFANIMIHSVSYIIGGKHKDNVDYVEFISKFNNDIIKKTYKHFLTDDEINKVLTGQNIWLYGTEIKDRFDRLQKAREDEYQSEQKDECSCEKNEQSIVYMEEEVPKIKKKRTKKS